MINKLDLEKTFISIVVYLKDDEEHISNFFQQISSVFENNFVAYEYILVDDANNNGLHEKIRQIARKLRSSVTLVMLSAEHGCDAAITAGVDLSIGDFVYEFESIIIDYPIELIMDVYRKATTEYDVVSLSPEKKSSMTSKLFYKMLEKYANRPAKLTTEVFRLVSRRSINRINSMSGRIRYRKILYHTCGMSSAVISYKPIGMLRRKKESFSSRLHRSIEIMLAYSKLPIRLCNTVAILFFCLSQYCWEGILS